MAVGESKAAQNTVTSVQMPSQGASRLQSAESAPTEHIKFVLAGSNFLSSSSFFWVFRLLWKCLTKDPENIEVSVNHRTSSESSSLALSNAWDHHHDLLKACMSAFGPYYAVLGLWKVLWGVFTWAMAWYLLQEMMRHPTYLLAGLILVCACGSAVAIQRLYHDTFVVGLRVKAAILDLIYRRCMVLSPANVNIGHIMTMIANDVEAIADCSTQFHFLWSAGFEVAAILIIAYVLSGWRAALAPILVVVAVIIPVQIYLGKVVSDTSRRFLASASRRLHLMTEILTAIKLVKFYAWEDVVRDKIAAIRAHEATAAYRQIRARAINFAFVFAGPVVAALSCLLVLQLSNYKLDPILAFTLVSLFNTLRYPLLMLPLAVKSFSSACSAFTSINVLLNKPEMRDQRDTRQCGDKNIIFRDASLKWEHSDTNTLKNISLRVEPGEILAVVGGVGSGKSSLVAAMLGQMQIVDGMVSARGLMSFCPQEPWLINSTLRENILFGTEFDHKRYCETIKICSMERDLSLFPEGDLLPISERGANLSGGQRQRVSIARAVYSYSDIILLDDPLSALDQAVGRQIFDSCIKMFLKDRAVVLVTHQLQYLPECSNIAIMENGCVAEYGSFYDLMAIKDGRLRKLMHEFSDFENSIVPETIDEGVLHIIRMPSGHLSPSTSMVDLSSQSENKAIELTDVIVSPPSPTKATIASQSAITRIAQYNPQLTAQLHPVDEAILTQKAEYEHKSMFGPKHFPLDANGHDDREFSRTVSHNMTQTLTTITRPFFDDADVKGDKRISDKWVASRRSWIRYMRQAGTISQALSLFFFFWLVHCMRLASDVWVKVWQGAPGSSYKAYSLGASNDVTVYAVIIFLFATGVTIRGLWLASSTAAKARSLHDSMLRSLIRAPMSFYDKTPLGRILQSSSKHQSDADDRLPDALLQWMQYVPLAIGSLAIMTWQSSLPLYMFVVIIVLFFLAGLLVWFPRTSGADNYYKNQQAISRTMLYSHITASLEGLFSIRAFRCQDRFQTMLMGHMNTVSANDLAGQSIRFLIALYIDVICSISIFFCAFFFVVSPSDSATIGLSLSNALQLLVFVQWALRMWEEASASMQSIGNLQFMAEKIPAEAPAVVPASRPDADWPTDGSITFQDVVLRYSTFGVAVLKRISFQIQPMEKIGIVGRTGSGKSTLLVSLLRIVELSAGRIVIDGVDIAKLGLEDLRRRIAIIPQESVLFSGTIRHNLDPTGINEDDALWHSLDAVNLADKIRALPQGLDTNVESHGPRFSLGQRQLFCIARAILMKSRVVVLDEATAAIDAETDAMVQRAITLNFTDCTVLTIAHRLNTIIQSDRILIMDAGKVVEFDKPLTLLDNKGHFHSLVENTGPETARKLRQLAQEKFEKDQDRDMQKTDAEFFTKFIRPIDPL
uniref:Uncharacterized protein n=1 Tax=Spongospora subterranea TaxID=70186 RepID=A0A0H5R775_9EUKA|eukprot:CRZ09963.1 hypothetical protein [Spongospora subterranea]